MPSTSSREGGTLAWCTINKTLELHSPFCSSTRNYQQAAVLPQTPPERLYSASETTILYLAYGSNLSRETFVGNRGIKPISAVNVHVPSLDLTFDLAGVPYTEPCFANSAQRTSTTNYGQGGWDKGMIGVVYEVTPEDYRTIIATEGGGSSYQDVVVDSYPILPGLKTLPSTHSGDLVRAHTLLAPPGAGGRVSRPDPTYAQASARYLKLITDGAEQHRLPEDYLAYLYSLQPYTITTYRQSIGKALFAGLWMPFFLAIYAFGSTLVDEEGKIPGWLARFYAVLFKAVWATYDSWFKPAFGDGERTIESGDEESKCEQTGTRCCEKGAIRLNEK